MTTEATPTSNHPQCAFSFPPVNNNTNNNTSASVSNTQNQFKSSQPGGQRVGNQQQQIQQATPQVKSILKSPSTTSEKSIHFDDHIDVIQIDDRSLSTATSSPPSQSQPVELEADADVAAFSQAVNLDLFKPLKGISQTEMAKNMLFQQQQQKQNQRGAAENLTPSQSHFSNEIEAIKKMLLEPIGNKRPGEYLDAPPDFMRMKSAASAGRSRVFIKSPTPMRELPDFNNTGQSIYFYLISKSKSFNLNLFKLKILSH